MTRVEAALLVSPFLAGAAIEARGLRQADRAPEDRATYSAGGRRLFRLDTRLGRFSFVMVLGAAIEWFVHHMFRGASESLARAAAAVVEAFDDTRPEIEETP